MSGVVRGPTPTMIVNTPTRVPRRANPWTDSAARRSHWGWIQVNAKPARSTSAITPSAMRLGVLVTLDQSAGVNERSNCEAGRLDQQDYADHSLHGSLIPSQLHPPGP